MFTGEFWLELDIEDVDEDEEIGEADDREDDTAKFVVHAG